MAFVLLTFLGERPLSAANRVMGLQTRAEMEWRGFSIQQLPDPWFLYKREQSKTRALFHRDFVTPEHTMAFQVRLTKVPQTGGLAAAVRPRVHHNQVVINYTQNKTTRDGQAAIDYACEIQDLKLSRKFKRAVVTRERGLAVIHPFLANTVVHIVFSETAPEDELHEAAFSQADNIMNRVALEAPH
jgi:hypothetical protein